MRYLVFTMAGEEFGVSILQVKEILKMGPIDSLPCAPHFIEGIMRVRRHSIVVMDLRRRFGLDVGCENPAKNVVMLRDDGMIVGCLVDGVKDVIEIEEPQMDAGLRGLNHFVDEKLIQGVALYGKRTIILINVKQVLSTEEKKELQMLGSVGAR